MKELDENKFFSFEEDFLNITLNYIEAISMIKNTNYPNFINSISMYIKNNIYERISVSIIADHFQKEKYYLSKLFKKVTGHTLQDYIINHKVIEAEHLLRYSDITIQEISELLFFYDSSHFSKVFENNVGVSPSIYRMENKFIYHLK